MKNSKRPRTQQSRKNSANHDFPWAFSNATPKQQKKKTVPVPKKKLYRRRRIVVFSLLAIALALAIFCAYSLIRGVVGMVEYAKRDDITAISRSSTPPVPIEKSKVKDCSLNDIELDLVPESTAIPVGGSLKFTAKIQYSGNSSAGCYVDGSSNAVVLTIDSGNDEIWRSDVCDAIPRPLLLYAGTHDEQEITWPADRTGTQCVPDDELPRVDRGTYTAQLMLKDHPKVVSKPVSITVE